MTELSVPGCVDLERVGSGGFGTVYRAFQPTFRRTVAVKVLTGVMAGGDVAGSPEVQAGFERECRAIGSVSGHPNIVAVYDAGVSADGRPYLVMAFEAGGSLADQLELDGRFRWPDVLRIGVKLGGALHTAHQTGVLHRDLKPENVLVSEYGQPLLADFGIARIEDAAAVEQAALTAQPVQASVAHASPEVLSGRPATEASDVYGLGSLLHALLVGHAPFARTDEETVLPMLVRIADEAPPDLRRRGVPDAVARVLEHAMAKDPSDRPPSALALGRDLQAAQRTTGVSITELPIAGGDAASGRVAIARPQPDTPASTSTSMSPVDTPRPSRPPPPVGHYQTAPPPGWSATAERLTTRMLVMMVVVVAVVVGVLLLLLMLRDDEEGSLAPTNPNPERAWSHPGRSV